MKLREYQHQLEESKEFIDANRKLKIKFSLAKAVYEARTRKGWTQSELAKAMGTKQANISRIESGLANPTLEFLFKLSTILGFNIDFSNSQKPIVQFVIEPKEAFTRNCFVGVGNLQDSYHAFDLSPRQSVTLEEKAGV